jgi:hypothetical protein
MQTKIVSYEQAYIEVRRNGNNIEKVDTSKFSNEQYYELAMQVVQHYTGFNLSYIDDSRLSDEQYQRIVYKAVKYSGTELKYVNKARFSADEYDDLAMFAVKNHGSALKYVDPAKLPKERIFGVSHYTYVVLEALYYDPGSSYQYIDWDYVSLMESLINKAAKGGCRVL